METFVSSGDGGEACWAVRKALNRRRILGSRQIHFRILKREEGPQVPGVWSQNCHKILMIRAVSKKPLRIGSWVRVVQMLGTKL
mmetsp:Transcript_39078/g.75788  ORF Transcript_39078/g.75788 Transcript_39078/m.75788 type:complete len:84 (+) Transcript_39078:539-790(+)